MTWADAVPNLLIGLREGLEAGLVVSILLAALHKTNAGRPERRIAPAAIWLGVLGAVAVAASFAAVLTFTTDALSSATQDGVGGALSVLAVVLVTAMIFWMRRTARDLAAHLRGDVERAVAIGAGALTLTAFLAVGREGLETTLFLWTAVRASGSTAAPLIGAAAGLAIAIVLCRLLYVRAVRIDLGKFFNRTALALIVIAAGVLAYGLGDLQDAGWLPGGRWIAFDLTAHVDPNSWWVSIVSGATELAPRMSVLQVVAWLVYTAVVVPLFLRARAVAPPAAVDRAGDTGGVAATRWERVVTRRPGPVAALLVAVPAAVAGVMVAALPSADAGTVTAVSVTKHGCAEQWTSGHTGPQTFQVDNTSGQAGEIDLDDSGGAVVAEIETIGPATTAPMTATLGGGQYTFVCLMSGGTTRGAAVQVSGRAAATTPAVTPVTLAELDVPNRAYEVYAADRLQVLGGDVVALQHDLARGDLVTARRDWLTAQLDWERVGASYDSFGAAGEFVDGLPDGLAKGVEDPGFTGLHRLEYGLYHEQTAAALVPVADRLSAEIVTVRRRLDTADEAGDATNLPLRVHEILEDALRDHLSGIDDQGSGTAYAQTWADTQVDEVVLSEVAPLVDARMPHLVATARRELAALQGALLRARVDGSWLPAGRVDPSTRRLVDARIGSALSTLSLEPNLLEVPPTH